MNAKILVCCGSGGVGKTTTSAAMAIKAAMDGARVVVLTIDPAHRLADCLKIQSIEGAPTEVPLPGAIGFCDAVMLNIEETFAGLIRSFSTTPARAEAILANRYFQFSATRLGGVHEFMAAEKLRELATCGRYDLVVVDTPPSRHALDFLKAPDRIAQLMDGGVMRWMAMPATRSGWRALELGSEAVVKVLGKVVGRETIAEIAQFFELFRELWDGFLERSLDVQKLLRANTTRFYLISSPAPTARAEALFFLEELNKFSMPFGGFVINRVQLPLEGTADIAQLLAMIPGLDADVARQLTAMARKQTQVAERHQASIKSLRSAGPQDSRHWAVPDLGRPIDTLNDLLAISKHLPRPD